MCEEKEVRWWGPGMGEWFGMRVYLNLNGRIRFCVDVVYIQKLRSSFSVCSCNYCFFTKLDFFFLIFMIG